MARETGPSPFDYVRVISDKSNVGLFSEHRGRGYAPFVAARALSYYPDTIVAAAIASRLFSNDPEMHWSFLLSTVRKKKRYPRKWAKPPKEETIMAVARHYGISLAKACEIMPLLPTSFVEALS